MKFVCNFLPLEDAPLQSSAFWGQVKSFCKLTSSIPGNEKYMDVYGVFGKLEKSNNQVQCDLVFNKHCLVTI